MKKFVQLLSFLVVMAIAFNSQAQGISLPYYHDFDSDGTGVSSPLPTGWSRLSDAPNANCNYPCVFS